MDDLEAHPVDLDGEDSSGSGGSKLPLVALLVGVIGMILGVVGMYMAAQATNALDRYKAELANAPDTTGEQLRTLERQIASVQSSIEGVEERLGTIGGQQVGLQRADREMREQTQRAFEGVSREVSANRSQLNETTAKLEELMTKLSSGTYGRAATSSTASVSQSASSSAGSTASGSSASSGGSDAPTVPEGVHVVQSGDTLSSIAKQYGVTLGEIMAANPTVDSRRMQIGQQIVIPAR
jgi:LysM repeat protein